MIKILQPELSAKLTVLSNATTSILRDESIAEVTIEAVDLSDLSLKQLKLTESLISKCNFSQTKIDKFDILECTFKGCDFTATKFINASWHVALIEATRCSGLQMTDGSIKNVKFINSKLELVNFRFSRLENVVFEDCILDDADFNDAKLKNVEFNNCTIKKISFKGARMLNVDLSSSEIEGIGGAASLKGATISYDQLMQLGPLLAAEAGIKIK